MNLFACFSADGTSLRLSPKGNLLTSSLLLASTLAVSNALYAGEAVVLTPTDISTPRGSASRNAADSLAVQDQHGLSDDWLSYIEFYPGKSGLVSFIDFDVPINFVNSRINSLEISVNYRGPASDEQRWKWHIRNFRTNRWNALGDNSNVPDWKWTTMRYSAEENASDYVSLLGNTRLRYSSSTDIDHSNLDSVSVEIMLPDPEPIESPPLNDTGIWSPAPGTSWQWQLLGEIDTSLTVDMYDIDLFDTPQSVIDELQQRNVIVICYFSAGSFEDWRTDASQFPASVLGASNGWAGERWLDIRLLDALAPIMSDRLDLAVSKGCDGVEPDNVDGYANNTGFPLTAQDQLDFNIWLADAAHARGLSIGLKNDLDQVAQLEPWFDWALNEQCVQYDECDLLSPFVDAGKAVFGVDYYGQAGSICSVTNALDFDWLVKPIDLTAERQACR